MNFCGIFAPFNYLALNYLQRQKMNPQNEFLRTQKMLRIIAEFLRTELLGN